MRTLSFVLAAVLFGVCCAGFSLSRRFPHVQQQGFTNDDVRPSSADCTWKTFDQTLDHFVGTVSPFHGNTFSQRYCIVDKYWKSPSADLLGNSDLYAENADVTAEDLKGPIFFYTGNESPVEEYINNTGLIWELAPQYGALIIFAEHRYEGESVPPLVGTPSCLSFCSTTQAVADYANLIDYLKTSLSAQSSPVIAFGGSYGGMLSAYLRFKFPNSVVGAIAASAPIWGLPKTTSNKGLDGSSYAISRGVSQAGGATDTCRDNLKFAWPLIHAIGGSIEGRELLSSAFRLCSPLLTTEDVSKLIAWGTGPWFNLAEGNYPFPSTYITFAVGPGLYPLPPWPMRVACEGLNKDFGLRSSGDISNVSYSLKMGNLALSVDWNSVTRSGSFSKKDIEDSGAMELLGAVRDAVAVWYNVTGQETCFRPAAAAAQQTNESVKSAPMKANDVCTVSEKGSWQPLCCNDNLNLVNYISAGMGRDIYWPPTVPRDVTVEKLVDVAGATTGCAPWYASQGLYGVPDKADPWSNWYTTFFGGRTIRPHSNIVFSNGLIDPWSSAGVFGPGGIEAAIEEYDTKGTGNAVVQNVTADGSIVAVVLGLGGHHLDLFFSTPEDPPCAVQARQIESAHIAKWIKEGYENFFSEQQF